ncbi:MAG: PKD domain-containing protein [Dysgonamonadaceae bacterium]|jgi:PKD repeat protein|nr:PKD domain-containing protein [Dysgonamonadaceae bacterium]
MKQKRILLSLWGLFCAFASYAQYESVVLEDAFGDDRTAQADVIQGNGTGNLYIKGIAAGSGIRESFIKLSLAGLDNLTETQVNYAKVELRLYTARTNVDAATNQIGVYPVGNEWSETTLTWTNSRSLSSDGIAAGAIATGTGKRVAGYSGSGQQGQPTDAYNVANESRFDISAYAIQQYKSGNKTISVMLHVTNTVNNGDQQLVSKDVATDVPGYDLKLPKVIISLPAPSADFTITGATHFKGIPVSFTNTSAGAKSYAWDFGDGETSIDANPVHTYASTGDKIVKLTVTGYDDVQYNSEIVIHIYDVSVETLAGGDMETADTWGIVGAGTFADGEAAWGITGITGFGADGYLYVTEENGTGTQYYIFQAVRLLGGSRYDLAFDYAVESHLKAWCEVYIGTALPGATDYTDGGSRGTKPLAWTDQANQNGNNVAKQYSYSFIPTEDGVYFYVIKFGTNGNGKFHVAVDNVTLTKISDPVADFTASATNTWISLPLTFTNTSLNGVSCSWDFGDNTAISTEASPSHTYTAPGIYTVTLTTTGSSSATDTKTVEIKVLGVNHATIAGGNFETADRALWAEFGGVSGGTNSQLVWGDTPDSGRPQSYKPAGFDTGGFLTVAEDWSGNVSYKIAQAVELTAGSTYKISFDYAFGTHRRAWFQVLAATVVPTGADYTTGQIGGGLIPWSEDYSGNGGGSARKFEQNFTPETSGVYYFVIKWGCGAGDNGYFNASIDNVVLEETSVFTTVSVEDINMEVNAEAAVVTAFTDQSGEPVAAVITEVVSDPAAGPLIENREGAYYVKGLVAGVYILTVTAEAGGISKSGQATVTVMPITSGESPSRLSFRQTSNAIHFSEMVNAIKLYSLQGQTVLAETQTAVVSITSLPKGLYVLQLTDNQDLQIIHKIIIY